MKKLWKKYPALLLLGYSVASFGAIDALNFSSPQQEQDYHQLTEQLRCPQCQNNNIADSNATIAVDMRAKVFELLNEGKSKQQIVDYMVERYGNFVTYDPPFTTSTLLLWLGPFGLIIIGLLWILRRQPKTGGQKSESFSTSANNQQLSDEEQQRLNQLLNRKE